MAINIISFKKEYAQNFYDLNNEWLKTFFHVERYDEQVLSQPSKYSIDEGGFVFFAMKTHKVVGTVALMPTDKKEILELTKMAILPEEREQKIRHQVLQYCIDFGKSQKLKGPLLYFNTKLENAIYLYRKYGFKELLLEDDNPYKRVAIKMLLEFQN